jgi:hypothetical protein
MEVEFGYYGIRDRFVLIRGIMDPGDTIIGSNTYQQIYLSHAIRHLVWDVQIIMPPSGKILLIKFICAGKCI